MVENSNFIKRLRNVHLEKSAVTGLFHPSCSPTTAKTPCKVHLRLRFQNLGKPRTAALYLVLKSNGLRRPKIRLKKFGFSSKSVPATTPSQTAFHRIFQLLPQTPQRSFQGAAAGTHATPSPNRAHSGLHAETGAFLPSATAWLCAASEIHFIPPCFYIHTFPGSL